MRRRQCRWALAFAIAASMALGGCCSFRNPNRWAFAGRVTEPGVWRVLYSNQVDDRLDTISVVNCTGAAEGGAKAVELVLAREDPIRPPEPYPNPPPPKDSRLYEPPYDLSVVGARRLLVVETGRRLAVRSLGGPARICVRLVSTKSISLGVE